MGPEMPLPCTLLVRGTDPASRLDCIEDMEVTGVKVTVESELELVIEVDELLSVNVAPDSLRLTLGVKQDEVLARACKSFKFCWEELS